MPLRFDVHFNTKFIICNTKLIIFNAKQDIAEGQKRAREGRPPKKRATTEEEREGRPPKKRAAGPGTEKQEYYIDGTPKPDRGNEYHDQ